MRRHATGTLLDVGSGIGALTFGLLQRGITHAVAAGFELSIRRETWMWSVDVDKRSDG